MIFPGFSDFPIHLKQWFPRWVGATRHASPGWRFADSILGFQQPAELAPGLLRRCELSGPFRAFQGRRCRGFWGKNAALGWFNYVQLVFRRSGGGLKNLGMVDFFWNSAGGWGQVCHFPSSLGQLESLQRQDIGRVLMVWYQLPKCFGLNAELSTNALDVEKISKNTDWSNREVISRAG